MVSKDLCWLILIACILALGASQWRPNASDEAPVIPSAVTDNSLDLPRILADLELPSDSKGYILAYHSEVDDRPLYLDSILLAVKSKKDWSLCEAFRHPKDSPRWDWSIVHDANQTPRLNFDHRPTLADVRIFLKASCWKFESGDGFRTLKADIYEQAWLEGLGFSPPFKFR